MTVETDLTLRERAQLAYLDRIEADKRYLVRVAHEVADQTLDSSVTAIATIDHGANTITFTVDDLTFKVRVSTITRTLSSGNANIAGMNEEEERKLQLLHRGDWKPITDLSDVGKVLHTIPPNVTLGDD